MAGSADPERRRRQCPRLTSVWTSAAAYRALQVHQAYETALGRAPTSTELSAGISALNSGTTSTMLLQNLFTSQEFQNLHPTSTGLATHAISRHPQ